MKFDIGRYVSSFRERLVPSIIRFPLAYVLLLWWSVLIHLEIYDYTQDYDVFGLPMRLVAAGAVGSVMLRLILEARGAKTLYQHVLPIVAGLAFMALVYFVRPVSPLNVIMVLAPFLILFSAPYLGKRESEESFWNFTLLSISMVIVGLVAALAVSFGASVLIFALDELFGIGSHNYEIYQHIAAFAFALLWPVVVLMGVPYRFDRPINYERSDFLYLAHRRISDFIVAPVALVFAVILHIYALMVLVQWSVPEGQVGWLTICFGLVLVGFRLKAHILLEDGGVHTRWLLRNWPYLLVVPLILFAIATYIRIDVYGMTIGRYYLIAFGVFLALSMLGFLIVRRGWLIVYLPALAGLILFIGTFGPWGATSLTVSSQVDRFIAEMERLEMFNEAGGITPLPSDFRYNYSLRENLSSILQVLSNVRGLEALEARLLARVPDAFANVPTDEHQYTRIGRAVGLVGVRATYNSAEAPLGRPIRFSANDRARIAVSGYSEFFRVIRLTHNPRMTTHIEVDYLGRNFTLFDNIITAREGEAQWQVSLSDLRAELSRHLEGFNEATSQPAPLVIVGEGMAIAIFSAEIEVEGDDDVVTYISFDAYFR